MKKSVAKRIRRSQVAKIGAAPGTLVHVGEVMTKTPVVSLIEYSVDSLEERTVAADTLSKYSQPAGKKLWLNVHGLQDVQLIADIGQRFKLHPLVLEDILNTDQRPKVDSYGDYLYIVARCFHCDKTNNTFGSEQISLILGKDFVLTFQERPTGSFEPVRERLRHGRVHIREAGSDYLAYALLDVIVDRYFIALEQIGDDCEALEEILLSKPTTGLLHEIHRLKRESMLLRHSVWPLREVLNTLIRNDQNFFEIGTLLFMRDVYDHTVHFIESLEAIRDMLAGMLDIYLSSISNRVNMEVRALTVVAMLFMPATLVAGIFGMNFHEMPLLADKDGFWWTIGTMASIAIVMGLIFWRREWLSRQ
ncbi:MAG TPA: magnesium/cobalt transporter CorA [Methylophilaceae bacterium]